MSAPLMVEEAWDYLWIEPKVREYVEVQDHPEMISVTKLETWIADRYPWPPRLLTQRVRHCISRSLGDLGYRRRSIKGRTWDRVDT